MSEANKRKVHTPEFKRKVGLEALRRAKTINEIGHEYGVHPVQVRKKEEGSGTATLSHKQPPLPFSCPDSPRPSSPEVLWSSGGRQHVIMT